VVSDFLRQIPVTNNDYQQNKNPLTKCNGVNSFFNFSSMTLLTSELMIQAVLILYEPAEGKKPVSG
jgi:hypothetical protein